MNRKKAIAYNVVGPTCNFVGSENLNRIMTGGFANPVSCYNGADVYGATDYSYGVVGYHGSKAFRHKFRMFDWEDVPDESYYDNVFKLGQFFEYKGSAPLNVWYFYGARIIVECFDENAVIDFVGEAEDGANMAYAFGKFLVIFSQKYDVSVINEHLINVKSKEL